MGTVKKNICLGGEQKHTDALGTVRSKGAALVQAVLAAPRRGKETAHIPHLPPRGMWIFTFLTSGPNPPLRTVTCTKLLKRDAHKCEPQSLEQKAKYSENRKNYKQNVPEMVSKLGTK